MTNCGGGRRAALVAAAGFSDGRRPSFPRMVYFRGAHFELDEMEADHVTPCRDGGRTVPENCQMLCRDCNRRKGAR